ncbi:MAG: hypothetical protein SX243_04705 [Acidobacteriota bacterium]|nr:hypothetical protein [Acidobacteriota bacterium]
MNTSPPPRTMSEHSSHPADPGISTDNSAGGASTEGTGKLPVVLVSSLPFSASTLVGMILGSHPDISFLGETDLLMRRRPDGSWRHRKFCSICQDQDGEKCPVWSGELVQELRDHPDELHPRLARHLAAQNLGAKILVDSCKDEDWWRSRLEAPGIQPIVLHVSKAPEAYISSLLTRHSLRRPVELIALDWAQGNLALRQAALERGLVYHSVRYDDLVLRIREVLADLGRLLGFEPTDDQEEFWRHPQHNLRGNPGTASHLDAQRAESEPGVNKELYRQHHRTIFLDEKWKKVLSPRQVDRIHAMPAVRRACRILGYSHPIRTGGSPLAFRLAGHLVEPPLVLLRRLRHGG